MAKYFITGGTGFVGHHLMQQLSSKRDEIFCLCRQKKQPTSKKESIRWIEGDLLDSNSYKNALQETDYVVHLAGLLSARRKEEYNRVNVDGTEALLEACNEVGAPLKRFVHMSSIAVNGPSHRGHLLNENDHCSPQSEYGKSKRQAEEVVLSYSKSFPVVILRPTFIYGRGDLRGLKFLQSLNKPTSLLWLSKIKSLCLCHVSDVARSCLLSVQKDIKSGDTFIISDPEVSTWNDIWITLEKVLHDVLDRNLFRDLHRLSFFSELAVNLNLAASREGQHLYWACDTSKAQTILGFHPKMPFRKGAFDTIFWYIDQGFLRIGDIKQVFIGKKSNESTTENI